ncbi:uncharacterized protein LOC120328642 [Styela clava]
MESLSVMNTDLQPYTASVLKSCLENSTVSIINLSVSYNPNLRNGIVELGSIISHCKTKDVQMRGCCFSSTELNSFRESLNGYKVDGIDLSSPPDIPSVDISWDLKLNYISNGLSVKKVDSGKFNFQLPMQLEFFVTFENCMAISNLFIHCVKEDLNLDGWKFNRHLRGILETEMDYLQSGKTITLSKNDILRTNNLADFSESQLQFTDLSKDITLNKPVDIKWKESDVYKQYDIVLLFDDNKSEKFKMEKGKQYLISTFTTSQNYVLFIVGMPTETTGGTISGRSILNILWAVPKAETLSLKIIIDQNMVKFLCSLNDCKLQSANPVCATCQELTTFTIRDNLAEEQVMSGFLDGIETPDDMIKKCQEQNVLQWNEIQIAHTNVTKSMIDFVSNVISNSSSILEFALRDVNLTADLLTIIHSNVKNSFCQIQEFSINCQKNINTLLPVICKILSTCNFKILNMSENDVSEKFLRKLLQTLDNTDLVKTLIGLDLSYNTNIQDFSLLADIMKKLPIEVLRLMNCGIIEEYLTSLTKNISEGKVKHLNLSYNPEMTSSCFEIIVPLLHKNGVDFLGLGECELTNEKINALRKSLQSGTSIRAFDVSYNECLEFGDESDLILLIKNHNVKDLNVSGCELTEDQVESMGKALRGHEFETLNISDNVSIRDGVKHVGEMVGTCPIINLDMSECMFNTRQLNTFVDELGFSQLETLNISDSKRYVDTNYIKVVCKLVPKVKKELTVCFPRMSEGCLDLLQTTLDHTGNKNLRITYGYKTDSIKSINSVKFTPSVDMRKYLVYKPNIPS